MHLCGLELFFNGTLIKAFMVWHLYRMTKAWKLLENVHVPKPVPNLCFSSVQGWALLVHLSLCSTYTLHWYCLGSPCAHPVYNKSGYSLQISCITSLGTSCTLAWTRLVHSLTTNFPLAWAPLYTNWSCALLQYNTNVMVNRQRPNNY